MRILLIDYDAGTGELGGDTHSFDLAKEWKQSGAAALIVAADHSYLRRQNPEGIDREAVVSQEGVDFFWISSPPAADREKKILRGILPFERGLHRSLSVIEQWKPDAIVLSSRHLLGAYGAMWLAKKRKIPFFLEVRRIYPEHLTEQLEYEESHFLVRLFCALQKRLYTKSDGIFSIYGQLDEHIRQAKADPDRFVPLPRGLPPVYEQEHRPAQRHLDFIRRYKGKGNFILLAAGEAEKEQNLDLLIGAASQAPREVLFLIVGNGMYKPNLKRTVRERNLSNVLFLDGVAPAQLQDLFEAADGAYVGIYPYRWHRFGTDVQNILLPMAAGVPVLCAAGLVQDPVKRSGCGFSVSPTDPKELSEAVRKLAAMEKEERRRMGQLGKEYVHHQGTFQVQAGEFLRKIEEKVRKYHEKKQAFPS